MLAFTKTTIAATLAVLGIAGTLAWYAVAWYGIQVLKETRDAVGQMSSTRE